MTTVVYNAPDDVTVVFNPTPRQWADIILSTDDAYWLKGGNGEASIQVVKQAGDSETSDRAVTLRNGTRIEYLADQPVLLIKQSEPGRFLFTWLDAEGWIVPYDGSDCKEFVMDERGGDPFKVPRACLVDRAVAVNIGLHFLKARERFPLVNWVNWADLPLPSDWYDT